VRYNYAEFGERRQSDGEAKEGGMAIVRIDEMPEFYHI
jgi:hypothetical protein